MALPFRSPVPAFSQRISYKIIGVLGLFSLCAVAAIAMTLVLSWQLEGVAAAINDAGSQRMRSYLMGRLLAQAAREPEAATRVRAEMEHFDQVLNGLETGDPVRPLSPPRDASVAESLASVHRAWEGTMRPIVVDFLQARDGPARTAAVARYEGAVTDFVAGINELVFAMERSYAQRTNLLRTFQLVLAVVAVAAALVLIRFFVVLVIRPVDALHQGIRRMAGRDLTTRVEEGADDELGEVAKGFNRMAEQLQQAYLTLEDKVEAKTRDLAEKNRELAMLYEVTAFLNEPADIETLSRGFLVRLKEATGAKAGAVRLYSTVSEELFLNVQEGLSQEFESREAALRCGECICGEVMIQGSPAVLDTRQPPPGMTLRNCIREGFTTASAFTISHNKRTLGVFNLYFDQPRPFDKTEVQLLETLGQHLGVAVENQRLNSREKELAVSEERNLLAQELHDSIAQGLAFLNIQVQLLEDSLKKGKTEEVWATTRQLREGIQESYDDVRELLVHFRTRVQHADLDAAIFAALEKFEAQTGIVTEFERVGSGAPNLPEDEIQILYIVQESLSNIRKHAGAQSVKVRVERSLKLLRVVVSDDGVGFDPATNPAVASERHVGLKIIRERAHRIGGECAVDSMPGHGTTVTLSVPKTY